MEQKRILVVDDEPDLCEILCYSLRKAGYAADSAGDAAEALVIIRNGGVDLLLLDVMMPGMSGFEFARQLKAAGPTSRLPIIFLTARDAEEDILQGFGIGVDDYVKKPFSVREVVARVGAVLDRTHRGEETQPQQLCYEGLVIDLVRKTVTVDGVSVALTKTELEVLALLMGHPSQVFSRHEILERVWPHEVIVTDRAVDVNIARMRKKIGRYSSRILSRQGFGYLFEL